MWHAALCWTDLSLERQLPAAPPRALLSALQAILPCACAGAPRGGLGRRASWRRAHAANRAVPPGCRAVRCSGTPAGGLQVPQRGAAARGGCREGVRCGAVWCDVVRCGLCAGPRFTCVQWRGRCRAWCARKPSRCHVRSHAGVDALLVPPPPLQPTPGVPGRRGAGAGGHCPPACAQRHACGRHSVSGPWPLRRPAHVPACVHQTASYPDRP